MKFGVKVVELSTGNMLHITGTWDNVETMSAALMQDGYVVLNYWREV